MDSFPIPVRPATPAMCAATPTPCGIVVSKIEELKAEEKCDKVDIEALCPLCQMKAFETHNILGYMLAASGKTLNQVLIEMIEKFKTYNEMTEYVNIRKRIIFQIQEGKQ